MDNLPEIRHKPLAPCVVSGVGRGLVTSGSTDTYTLTVSGLLRKREEVAGEIATLQRQLTDAMAALDHLDATIRIFNPSAAFDDKDRRPPPIFAGFRGELSRFLLGELKRATGPITSLDLGAALLAARGGNTADRKAVVEITKRTTQALAKMREKGLVQSRPTRPGAQHEWWLSREGQEAETVGGWRNQNG